MDTIQWEQSEWRSRYTYTWLAREPWTGGVPRTPSPGTNWRSLVAEVAIVAVDGGLARGPRDRSPTAKLSRCSSCCHVQPQAPHEGSNVLHDCFMQIFFPKNQCNKESGNVVILKRETTTTTRKSCRCCPWTSAKPSQWGRLKVLPDSSTTTG